MGAVEQADEAGAPRRLRPPGLFGSRGAVARLIRKPLGVPAVVKMNNWNIPDWLEQEVRARDKACVYCGVQFIEQVHPSGSWAKVGTWEHIINDATIISRENIARCCRACNSSKGTKKLSDWMHSRYCRERGINENTVAEVAKKALEEELKNNA